MKYRYFFALGACSLALTLLPLAAQADPPPAGADKPGKPGGKPGGRKPGDLFGKPSASAEAHSDKAHDGNKGEHGKPGADDDKPGEGPKLGFRGDRFRGGLRQLHEEMKAGKLTKDQLKEKLAKLRESAGERGKQHRQELSRRWGNTLNLPSAREELKNHARRLAFLERAMVIAESEAKDKDKLTARISKLIDKENERHTRAMERFASAPPAASGAPSSSATPAVAPPPAASAEGAAK